MAQKKLNTSEINDRANGAHLAVLGTVSVEPGDPVPPDAKTLVLLGPYEPGFWEAFTASAEYRDSASNPLDRWSSRVIGALSDELGGTPLFPFGTPALPFIGWALRSGRAWSSPIAMLVHDQAGLFVSFRGAIALPFEIETPLAMENPCVGCTAPCSTACPVNALGEGRYDVAACHAYLDTAAGCDCMENGCAARRICPVSKTSGRLAAQSAFHMKAFHK